MKKISWLAILAGSCLLAATAQFEVANPVTKRVMPQNETGVVLSYYDAIKEAKNGVVNISTQKLIKGEEFASPLMSDPFFREFFGDMFRQLVPRERVERSLGSGVIITKDGYILTNNHVIDNSDKIVVTLPGNKKEYKAKVIGTDPRSDLAVIKIDEQNLKPLAFGDSDLLKEGDIVFAIGNPFAVGETVTQGIVSALNKKGMGLSEYENFIQTDASINPGNSGGALVDTRGALIGINTAIISQSGGNVGIGFAIPSNMAKKVAKALIEKGKVERGYLGVSIGDITEEMVDIYGRRDGALVLSVEQNSPADNAGLKRGDLITAVNDREVKSSADLKNIIGSTAPNTRISLDLIRDKKNLRVWVTLKALPDQPSMIAMENTTFGGLALQDITQTLRKTYKIPEDVQGVFVADVKRDSAADRSGFIAGDIIVQIENIPIRNMKEFEKAWRQYEKLLKKRVYVNRHGIIVLLIFR